MNRKMCCTGEWLTKLQTGVGGNRWELWEQYIADRALEPSDRVTGTGSPFPVCVFTAWFCLWVIWNISGISLAVAFRIKSVKNKSGGFMSFIWCYFLSYLVMSFLFFCCSQPWWIYYCTWGSCAVHSCKHRQRLVFFNRLTFLPKCLLLGEYQYYSLVTVEWGRVKKLQFSMLGALI